MRTTEAGDLVAWASSSARKTGERSPLADARWQYVDKAQLEDITAEEWAILDRQRAPYMKQYAARAALEMLAVQKDQPGFGYEINNYEHCLQAATLALRGGEDEETVVVALFHDLGFVACHASHGDFAAALLRPYISERNHWMLRHHMYFQLRHCIECPGLDHAVSDRWRGHPHFEYSARWVANYDQNSSNAKIDCLPLSAFEPMVYRVFSEVRHAVPVPGT